MQNDPSTEAIKNALLKPRDPKVTTAHADVASVSTDGGTPPTRHKHGGPNTAANAAFNDAAQGPKLAPNFMAVPGR